LDSITSRRRVGDAASFIAVFTVAFFFRFNTLGGALGGFSNDEFGYLARARQIVGGELPFRDFNDPGWFLTDYLSAAGQWLGGYNLRSEALLTIGMLSLGAALTFLLARKAAGSVVVALSGVALQIAFEPRHYNYPKIVLYAIGITLAWAYVEKPNRLRLGALGALIGVAFLFRHDHLVYLGTFALLTIALVHRASLDDAARAAIGLAAVVAAFIVPFLMFLALSGGVGEYFRSALVYVSRDAQRTSFSFPRFAVDSSKPLIGLTRTAPLDETRINVRWALVSDEERRERESRYRLTNGAERDGTWTYQLDDVSAANIEALVRDPLVDDTHGLDRTRFAVEGQARRLGSQFDSVENATAFLYYFLVAVPPIAAALWLRLRTAAAPARVLTGASHLVPLLVLAAMLTAGFLSRGSTNIRIPDVGVTSAVLIAWILAAVAGPDARTIFPRGVSRALARVAVGTGLAAAILSANGIAQLWRHLDNAFLASGPGHTMVRAREVWRALGSPPSTFNHDEEQPRLLQVAAYVNTCTTATDRLFVLGAYPELYYFGDRLFAGGHAWLLPLYYSDDPDEERILARLRESRVPIVLTEARAQYDEDYRPVFEKIDEYLEAEYQEAGEVDYGGPQPLRVLTRADAHAVGRYEPLGLPCFREKASLSSVERDRPGDGGPLFTAKSPSLPVDRATPALNDEAVDGRGSPEAAPQHGGR
jgi:hypothetical protein